MNRPGLELARTYVVGWIKIPLVRTISVNFKPDCMFLRCSLMCIDLDLFTRGFGMGSSFQLRS